MAFLMSTFKWFPLLEIFDGFLSYDKIYLSYSLKRFLKILPDQLQEFVKRFTEWFVLEMGLKIIYFQPLPLDQVTESPIQPWL